MRDPLRTPSERRKAHRHALTVDVVERTGGATYFQQTSNISVTGLHLPSTLPHPPGTRVSLALRFPNQADELVVEGEVVARPPDELGMAVRFVDLRDLEQRALERKLAAPTRKYGT